MGPLSPGFSQNHGSEESARQERAFAPPFTSFAVGHAPEAANHWLGKVVPRGYSLSFLCDERRHSIVFVSAESAARFQRFVALYVGDAAPGNSYGGCFPILESETPEAIFFRTNADALEAVTEERVGSMTLAICRARLQLGGCEVTPKACLKFAPRVSAAKNALSVEFNESQLPPRASPTALGDYVRVVDDPFYRRIDAYFLRRIEELAVLVVPNLALLHREVYRKLTPQYEKHSSLVVVPFEHVMKVRNHYRDSCMWEDVGSKHQELVSRADAQVEAKLSGRMLRE